MENLGNGRTDILHEFAYEGACMVAFVVDCMNMGAFVVAYAGACVDASMSKGKEYKACKASL